MEDTWRHKNGDRVMRFDYNGGMMNDDAMPAFPPSMQRLDAMINLAIEHPMISHHAALPLARRFNAIWAYSEQHEFNPLLFDLMIDRAISRGLLTAELP